MNNSIPDDIELQVDAFREQIATAAAIDTTQLSLDVQQLAEAIANARTHALACSAIHDVANAHTSEYAHAVIIGGLSAFAVSALIRATADELGSPHGLLARMVHVSWSIRPLGLALGPLTYVIPGEVL